VPDAAVLRTWLDQADRIEQERRFLVVDLFEVETPPSEAVINHLGSLLASAKIDLNVLSDLREALGHERGSARVSPSKNEALMKGDFGEVLMSAHLEVFDEYALPVQKLRFQVTPEQSQTGTDLICLRVAGDDISELHFVEGKVRIPLDRDVALGAHKQLVDARAEGFATVIAFIADRLYADRPDLYQQFSRYLRSREAEDLDTYGVCLVHEHETWNEAVLSKLDDLGDDCLEPLTVRVLLVKRLEDVIAATYSAAGSP
jgi:hypothetical protein